MTQTRSSTSAGDMAVILFSFAMAVAGAWIIFAGPATIMPVHWSFSGDADGWGSREHVGAMVLGLGVLTLLIGGGLGLAAHRSADPARRRALRFGQLIVLLALPAVAALTASASLAGVTRIDGAVPMAAMSLLFLVIGAFLGRVGPNPFVGVRTPWAYKSRLAWERSNRLAGRLMFVLGFTGVATAAVAPQPMGIQALLVGLVLAVIWSVIESWRVWRSDPDRQPF